MSEIRIFFVVIILSACLLSCTSAGKKDGARIAREYPSPAKKNIENQSSEERIIAGKLDRLIEKYWGADYKLGAEGPNRFDCSGFVKRIFSEAYNYSLPRSSAEQFHIGQSVSESDLEYGDLVFFSTNGRKSVSHVGVYIGNGKFAHASTSVGVTITAFDSDYYRNRYLGARRVLK